MPKRTISILPASGAAGLAFLLAACGGNGSGKPLPASTTTSPAVLIQPSPTVIPGPPQTRPNPKALITPSPAPSGSPSPTPSGSPTPTPSGTPNVGPNASKFLYVANSNDTITTLSLDPFTGAAASPVDTDMGTGGAFVPAQAATDAAGTTLFVTGATDLMAIGISGGKLTLPAAGNPKDPLATTTAGALGVVVVPGTTVALTADSNGSASFGFFSGNGPGSISAFTLQGSAGTDTLGVARSVASGTQSGPSSLTIDATGSWLYSSNPSDGNVQSVSVAVSGQTVTLGKPSTAVVDPAWSANSVTPNACVLLTQSSGAALLTGNSDGTISAFPVTAPGVMGAGKTVYTPSAALVQGNGCSVSGIAVDSKAQLVVISDSLANQLFAFSATISGGAVTLAPNGKGGGLLVSAPCVTFNGDGPVCYSISDPLSVGNPGPCSVQAFLVTAQGLFILGAPVDLPGATDAPTGITVSR